jgi:hypothetical protein
VPFVLFVIRNLCAHHIWQRLALDRSQGLGYNLNKSCRHEEIGDVYNLRSQIVRLRDQLAVFENRYGLTTPEFYERFEHGEMGDDADFFEWSATWEMVQDLQGDDERG